MEEWRDTSDTTFKVGLELFCIILQQFMIIAKTVLVRPSAPPQTSLISSDSIVGTKFIREPSRQRPNEPSGIAKRLIRRGSGSLFVRVWASMVSDTPSEEVKDSKIGSAPFPIGTRLAKDGIQLSCGAFVFYPRETAEVVPSHKGSRPEEAKGPSSCCQF